MGIYYECLGWVGRGGGFGGGGGWGSGWDWGASAGLKMAFIAVLPSHGECVWILAVTGAGPSVRAAVGLAEVIFLYPVIKATEPCN